MTLIATVAKNGSPFHQVIDQLYDGDCDPQTLKLLDRPLVGFSPL